MLLADSVYRTREKPESGEPVYSDFQGSSRLLVDKRMQYTQTAQVLGRFQVDSVYCIRKQSESERAPGRQRI